MPLKQIIQILILSVVTLSKFQTVVIVSTNDIHGSAFPTTLFRTDTNESYSYGGLQVMAQMIQTVRQQYGGNMIYLDAGDQFQGGLESSSMVSSGEMLNQFYQVTGLQAAAIGNHEFDFGPNFLFPYWQRRPQDIPNLAANLRSEKGEENFLPLQQGQMIFTTESGIKIGVIGLSTTQTPTTTGAFNEKLFPSYQFLNYIPIVIERSARLRNQGVNAVILLSHVGNNCTTGNTFGIWQEQTPQKSECSQMDEISLLIKGLPAGTLDGVLQGHRHKFSHIFINGIPVMGTINGDYYFNILYLQFYDGKLYNKKIEGPIPVCEKVFEKTRTCSYLTDDQLHDAGPLVSWDFHGKTVQKHQILQNIYQKKWLPLFNKFLDPIVFNEIYLQRNITKQTELGNLFTNLMNSAVPEADVVIIPTGSFRTIWYPGVIQYQHFYSMSPFDNTLNSFEMTGKQLLDTIQIIQTGIKAFYCTKGLKQTIGISSFGQKRFINATLFDGTAIDPTKNYRVLTTNFLSEGGGDFKNVIGKVYTLRNLKIHGGFRQLLQPQLRKLGTIKKNTLMDPNNPRIKIVSF